MRTAVVTDSNSGIFKEEAEQLGIYVIPMPVIVEGRTCFENEDITSTEFFSAMAQNKEVSSSQPSPGVLIKKWKALLEEWDEVIYIPMSSGLSGSTQAAQVLALDFEGKVAVADNHRISVTMRQSVEMARILAQKGLDAAQIKAKLEAEGPLSSVYLTVEKLDYLKHTGRVTPTTAAIADILNIKPVLMTKGEKFETCAKVHGLVKAKHTMINAVEEDRRNLFRDYADDDIYVGVATSCVDPEDAEKWVNMMKEAMPNYHVFYNPLSLSIACHTGPNAYGVGISLKPKSRD